MNISPRHLCAVLCIALATGMQAPAQTITPITSLPAASTMAVGDVFLIVADPAGTPVAKKASLSVVYDAIDGATMTFTGKTMSGAGNTFSNIPWSAVVTTPTTLSGYGIADAQALDATLTAFGGVTVAANKGVYATGADAFSTYDLTSGGRALGGVAGTSGTFPYFSSSNTVTLAAISSAGLAVLDDADASVQRATLGLVIGTDVLAPGGNGSGLTALNASNLGSGTVPDARFPATLPALNGSALTALNASNLGSGTVPDARFPATLPALNGSALTNLNASNLASGTVPSGRLPAVVAEIGVACSDETTAVAAGTNKVTFRMPYAMTLTAVRASVTTAPTGSTLIIDINEGGSTVLSTKLSIDASEKTSTTAASAAAISDTTLADDAEITIDFDQVGASVAGAGVKIWLIGTR